MMRMQSIGLLLTAALLLGAASGCSSEQGNGTQNDAVISGFNGVATNDGRLYYDHGKKLLTFFDFNLNKNLPVCAKPNCSHNSSSCDAYFESGVTNYAIYHNKLYFWQNDTKTSVLYAADKNGANREALLTLKNVQAPRTTAVYADGKVFFDTVSNEIDEARVKEKNHSANYSILSTANLACFDLNTKKQTFLLKDWKTRYGSLSLYAYNDHKLYYGITKLKNDLNEDTYDPADASLIFQDLVTQYNEFDLNMKTAVPFLPDTVFDYLIFQGQYATYWEQSGNEKQLVLFNLSTKEKQVITKGYPGNVNVLDNKVIYQEVKEKGASPVLNYYDLATKERKEVASNLPKTEKIMLTLETKDKFIGTLARYQDDLKTQKGNNISIYITKKDYFNGMQHYVEISDMG